MQNLDMAEHARKFPQLETERLLLREVCVEDCAAIFDNYTDPQVTEYFMEPLTTRQQAAAIVEEYIEYYRAGTGIVWAITLKGSPTLVGTCGYEVLSPYDQRGEIGYDLTRAYWGQGVMREALQAVLAYSLAQLDLNRIQAYVLTENARSIQLLRRLHFETEGLLREYRRFKGRFSDWVLMSLLKNDWQSQNDQTTRLF
jgi:ribosomal-protein-alanine N-acetyltransferase